MPTQAQFLALFRDSVFLTNSYININLVRIDERTSNIVILAGKSLEIEIDRSGRRTVR
ncbi:DUF6888 family protein [Aliterella atlantica]|uniref:DUF6888 family protein n=1 Tax=Aliterella atlantica TaxID=1827278 RepID=UPI0019103587